MKIQLSLPERESTGYEITINEDIYDSVVSEVKGNRFAIVTDRNVEALYGNALLNRMREKGLKADIISIEPGESSKSFLTLAEVHSKLAGLGMDRGSAIIALGGGVTGDLAGFAAATFMRGIKYYHVPTTLLAMVDSSVGGKTGIDLPEGKNLVGAFHQPTKVFICVNALDSLPEKEFRNGLVEMLKSGFIRDEMIAYMMENSFRDVMKRNKEVMKKLIFHAVKVKAGIVQTDEKESAVLKERMLLNYGHTFGHAYETLSGFSISHGQAVAAGMIKAAELSHRLGKLSIDELKRHNRLINKFTGGQVKLPRFRTDEIINAMKNDKKARQGKIPFILLKRIGESYVDDNVPEKELREVLEHD